MSAQLAPESQPTRIIVDLVKAEVAALRADVAMLRAKLANHCACTHDGRGMLVTECQEHEEQRNDLAQCRQILAADMTVEEAMPEPQQALLPVASCVFAAISELRDLRARSVG